MLQHWRHKKVNCALPFLDTPPKWNTKNVYTFWLKTFLVDVAFPKASGIFIKLAQRRLIIPNTPFRRNLCLISKANDMNAPTLETQKG
jgi:hypothetical protein